MEYLILSWDAIYNLTLQLSERIVNDGFKPDTIVGIARGGWIPARILSDVLYADTLQNIRIEYYSDVGVKGKEPITLNRCPDLWMARQFSWLTRSRTLVIVWFMQLSM
jgi:hypoxanthine phosphoribosyltransferase